MKWLLGLLCLIFLIIFHEFGHFIAAKIFGVKVESFSVGFGPVLFHKKIHGTDFRFSLFPLGGYCGMKGEKDFQKALENNLTEISADSDSLYGIHPLKRALVGFFGPFYNFIFAIIAFSLIAMIGYKYYTYSNKILIQTEKNQEIHSNAAEAGIISGDIIKKINNSKIEDFSDLIQEISTKPNEELSIEVERNGKILTFLVHSEFDKASGSGKIGISADTSMILEKETKRLSLFPALLQGTKEACNAVYVTIKSIKVLFMGVDVKNAVSGPARVTDMLGTSITQGFKAGFRQGIVSTLSLMAIISISLFIMNLLPIPVLDGGLILIAVIEFITRHKIRPKIQYYIQFFGFLIIITIFIIGLTGDINYFVSNRR